MVVGMLLAASAFAVAGFLQLKLQVGELYTILYSIQYPSFVAAPSTRLLGSRKSGGFFPEGYVYYDLRACDRLGSLITGRLQQRQHMINGLLQALSIDPTLPLSYETASQKVEWERVDCIKFKGATANLMGGLQSVR